MGFGSKPKRPQYEEQADTPWITRNRDMNEWSYGNIKDNINRVNVFDDATRQSLNDYVDDIYNRSKADFDRTYAQTMARTLARDYNRFGTTGASTSLLNRDNYNLQKQRELADLAYKRAETYEDMINKELDRRYKYLDTNYGYFTGSGQTTQNFDDANWKIRNMNKDIQYLNDIQDYNSKANTWNAIGKTLSTVGGAVTGVFNPALGLAVSSLGNSLTDAFASPIGYSGSSAFGVSGGGPGYYGNSYDTDWSNIAKAIYNFQKGRGSGSTTGTTPQAGYIGTLPVIGASNSSASNSQISKAIQQLTGSNLNLSGINWGNLIP